MKIPILKLRNVLLTSIQVDLTDEQAVAFQSDILRTLNTTDARGLVIDITAMEVVDSFLARVLNDTARMARAVGAEVVLCGMQPEVAVALVEMGREMKGVHTALNLDQAYDKLQQLMGDSQGRTED